MSEHDVTADKLVKAYVKIRDKRTELKREYDELGEQQDLLKNELLSICKDVGTDGLRTEFGTVTRKLNKRYWTGC